MPIKGAAYGDHIFIKDLSYQATYTKKGAKTRLDINMAVHIPGVRGSLDAKRTGKIFAAEVIDTMRRHWETGRRLEGGANYNLQNTPSKKTQRLREQAANILTGNTFTARAKKAKTKVQEQQQRYLKRSKELKKRYTYRGKQNAGPAFIAGLKTRDYGKSKIYIPDPNNPSLAASGLMLNSLSGKYIPDADYINKAGKRVITKSHVNIRVRGDRSDAATLYGGMNQAASILNTGMIDSNSFKQNFPATAEYLDNAVYVNDRRQAMENMRRVVRFLSLINRNKALFL